MTAWEYRIVTYPELRRPDPPGPDDAGRVTEALSGLGADGWEAFGYNPYHGTFMLKRPVPAAGPASPGDPVSPRIRATDLVTRILRDLGAMSAVVPRGPLRDRVDDEIEHMAELAEAVSTDLAAGDAG